MGCGPPDPEDEPPEIGETLADWQPEAPADPEAPRLDECPEGWAPVADDDDGFATVCEPWPTASAPECPPGQIQPPGEAACRILGPACPPDGWPEDLPGDRLVLHVQAGADPEGDGSLEAPFDTLGAALDEAPDGAIIAVAAGTYVEDVTLRASVTLWGACTQETAIVSASPNASEATVWIRSAGTGLRNLVIGGDRGGVAVVGGDVHLENVEIREALGAGLVLHTGASATAEHLAIRGTRTRADGTVGRGIAAQAGSEMSARWVLVEGSGDVAVIATQQATVHLEDAAILRSVGQPDGSFGRGVQVLSGGHVILHRTVIEANRDHGVHLAATNSRLTAEDLVVRGTLPRGRDGAFGRGLGALEGAQVRIVRGTFDRNREGGAIVGADAYMRLEDTVVRRTLPQQLGNIEGWGLGADAGGHLELHRVRVEGNREVGLFIDGDGTRLTAEDLVVMQTQSSAGDGTFGRGLQIQDGALASIIRGRVEANRQIGIAVDNLGTEVHLIDVAVVGTLPEEGTGSLGRGIHVQRGAQLQMLRGLLAENHETALLVATPYSLVGLDQVAIRDTRSEIGVGLAGRGIGVYESTLLARGIRLDRNREAGIMVDGATGRAVIEDAVIADTMERACATDLCAGAGGGVGAVSSDGASIDMRRFLVTRSAFIGIQLTRNGEMDLHEGEVSYNPIGANVQNDGFDIERLMDQVRYRENDVNLDSRQAHVPDPWVPTD
jgi:hypothetical protein